MGSRSVGRLRATLLAVPTIALACGGLPPDAPLPQTITTIRLGLIACPGGTDVPGVVPLNLECEIHAEVFDEWGIPIHEPSMVWRSNNSFILTAHGSGKVGKVKGLNFGTAIVTASDPLGQVKAETSVKVVTPR